ncbi:MAG: spondin domain-containing protein [Gaiellaceae bacterium]
MKRVLMFSLAALAVLAIGAAPAYAGKKESAKSYTYKITVENLTKTQPLSPPVFAVHKGKGKVWQPGKIASHGVAGVAEDANGGVLVDALNKLRSVHTAGLGADAPIGPGASAMFEVTTKGRYNRLSIVSMLVNTNDAFTGLNSKRLNRAKNKMRMVQKGAYDAGSEANTQFKTDIPGPCCMNPFVRVPEGDVIRKHDGIKDGVGDLTVADYGWTGPVAKITIERVES